MKTAALLAFLLCCAAPSSAQDAVEAQKAYDRGHFAAAAAAYEALAARSPGSAALHYDLGNALLKAGRTGPAVAAYLRAFELQPRDADIRHNLDYALRLGGEELVPAGVPGPLFLLFHLLSRGELAGLQWLLLWAWLLLASAWLWRPEARARVRGPLTAALCLWGLTALWLLARRGLEPRELGVIVAARAEIRSGPGESFPVAFTAPEGRRVEVLESSGEWVEIGVLKEGARGWAPRSAVRRP